MSGRYFLYKPIIGICKQYTSLPCVACDFYQPLQWTESESIVILDNVGLNSCGHRKVINNEVCYIKVMNNEVCYILRL